jgi:hypothetical protein
VDDKFGLAVQIKTLHREIFWTRCVGAFLILFVAAFVLSGRGKHPRTVEATEFLLKDDSGNVIGRLGKEGSGGVCLALTAKSSDAGAHLCSDDGSSQSSSYLVLYNGDGVSLVSLSAGYISRPKFNIDSGVYIVRNDLGRKFLNLRLGQDTELAIGKEQVGYFSGGTLFQSYERTAVFSIFEEKPTINLFDKSGRKVWSTDKK